MTRRGADEPARPGRDFNEVAARVEALRHPLLRRQIVAEVDGYPFYRLDLAGEVPAPQRWLLSSGTHGDEPAGLQAMLGFLERDLERVAGHADLVILPCINPWGWVHDVRENAAGVDINRAFEDDGARETVICKQLLGAERFDVFVEFHEDWEFEGFYLFECRRSGTPAWGADVIDSVRHLGPILERTEVDDVPIVDGVATADESLLARADIGQKALPLWLFAHGTERALCLETPSTAWDLALRVAAHRQALETCLTRFLGVPATNGS